MGSASVLLLLVMVYNVAHEPCPLVFDGEDQLYTIPSQNVLVDQKISRQKASLHY
jgi:hypothetical protein